MLLKGRKPIMKLFLLQITTSILLLFIIGNSHAGEQDVVALETKKSEISKKVEEDTNGRILPDAMEEEVIKYSIIAIEMINTGASIETMSTKYNLTDSEQRMVIAIVYGAGSGGGVKPYTEEP